MSGPGAIGFTDIVGFTEFCAEAGDAAAVELLTRQRRVVDDLLPPGARVVKELGDGLLLWVDEAVAALDLAAGVRAAFAGDVPAGGPTWLRTGFHWGDPVRRGDDLVGHDVNVAARIADQAGPGEIVVSERLVEAADGAAGHPLTPIGPVTMKGLPEPVWLFRLG